MAKYRKGRGRGRGLSLNNGWDNDPMRQLLNKASQYRSTVNEKRITQRVGIFGNSKAASPSRHAQLHLGKDAAEKTERDLDVVLGRPPAQQQFQPIGVFVERGFEEREYFDDQPSSSADQDYPSFAKDNAHRSNYASPRKKMRVAKMSKAQFNPPMKNVDWSVGTASSSVVPMAPVSISPQQETMPLLDLKNVKTRLTKSCPKAPLLRGLSYSDQAVQRLTKKLTDRNPDLVQAIKDNSDAAEAVGSGFVLTTPNQSLSPSPRPIQQPQTESVFTPHPPSPYFSHMPSDHKESLFLKFDEDDEFKSQLQNSLGIREGEGNNNTSLDLHLDKWDDFGFLGLGNPLCNPPSPELGLSVSSDTSIPVSNFLTPLQFVSPANSGQERDNFENFFSPSPTQPQEKPPSTGRDFLVQFFDFL